MTNIDELLKIDMVDDLPLDQVESILSEKPFYKIDGGLNFRDLSDGKQPNLRTGFAFRSGSLENLTSKGQEDLIQLGIKNIFDLRSMAEFTAYPAPPMDGIDVTPATANSNWNQAAANAGNTDLGTMYMYVIEASKPCFRALLNHILNCPEKPFLFHCAAGKDRTGVAAAVILRLAGLSPEYIAREYSLTRIGIEPARDFLIMKLTGGKTVDIKSVPILHALANSRAETMLSMLQQIDEKYGSIDDFAINELNYAKEEIEKMRKNLRASEA